MLAHRREGEAGRPATGNLKIPQLIRSVAKIIVAAIKMLDNAGQTVFNAGCRFSPDIYTAVLVSLQTDYAGWKGARQLKAAVGGAA